MKEILIVEKLIPANNGFRGHSVQLGKINGCDIKGSGLTIYNGRSNTAL